MEMSFISDDMERPLYYWWQKIALPEGVSLESATEYADREGLARKRQRFLDSVKERLINKMKLTLVHEKFEDYSNLRQVSENFHALISPVIKDGVACYRVPPTSLEASARVYLQVTAYVDAQRAAMMEMIENHAPGTPTVIDAAAETTQALAAPITDDEANILVATLLNARRRKDDDKEDL
jgi:uncharacterized Fe-S center protein